MQLEAKAAASGAGAQTLERGCEVLLDIGRCGREGARITDLTNRLGLSRPIVHRLLQSFVAFGFVTQDGASRRYRLGPMLHVLGLLAPGPHARLAQLRPPLERLAQDSGHTAYLMLRRADEVICLARADSPAAIRTYLMEVGAIRPIGSTISGIAMLAGLPDEEVEAVLARTAAAMTHYRNASADYVRLQIGRVRRNGYCLSEQVYLEGATGLSARVDVPDQPPHLAVSLSAISSRVTPASLPGLVERLRVACAELADIAAGAEPAWS